MTHCNSCGAPVPEKEPKSVAFCNYCTDDNNQLLDRNILLKGTAGWLQQWSPVELSDAEALRRADLYLQSMPHWAESTK